MTGKNTAVVPTCYHCGEPCDEVQIQIEEKSFCCQGCKMVFDILDENDLCAYYDLADHPGVNLKAKREETYAYLDDPDTIKKIVQFEDEQMVKVTFFFPQIHCSSCIWLLENLYKLHGGMITSRVNFLKKEASFTIQKEDISLRQLVEILASIGYAPAIQLSQLDEKDRPVVKRSLYYKVGIAGFAFGNMMLLSFPEYLGLEEHTFRHVFGYLNIALAIPVLFYSGIDYLKSAWQGIRYGQLNMDVPIALGMLTLFIRSVYEIIAQVGAGYLDSLAGLVFFLLIGKWFQQRTYYALNFERDYKSYFPIAVAKKVAGEWRSVTLDKIDVGDIIWVRNGELIPTDGLLTKGDGQIDYSFVTGESAPVPKQIGEQLYAGGKQVGAGIEITVTHTVAQSYLTQLWNDSAFEEDQEGKDTRLANQIGTYFTFIILTIAFTTLAYWLLNDVDKAFQTFTAVLIIACPCAIALAIPFTYGNVLRWLAKFQFFLKNILVIERIQEASHFVFDKTGTLTQSKEAKIFFNGPPLQEHEKKWISALANQSNHPLSRAVSTYLGGFAELTVSEFEEIPGAGTTGQVDGHKLKLGSATYAGATANLPFAETAMVFVGIDGSYRGYFAMRHPYREGLEAVMKQLDRDYQIALLSGDNDSEKAQLLPYFKDEQSLHFRQTPKDKLNYIANLQLDNHRVVMIGDGLNDAGALQQSDVGMVITENINNFTPASDAIMAAASFTKLPAMFSYVKRSRQVIWATYAIAFIYNVVGLSFAVQGLLSPVIAAILMPLSSITVVIFGVGLSSLLAWKLLH